MLCTGLWVSLGPSRTVGRRDSPGTLVSQSPCVEGPGMIGQETEISSLCFSESPKCGHSPQQPSWVCREHAWQQEPGPRPQVLSVA